MSKKVSTSIKKVITKVVSKKNSKAKKISPKKTMIYAANEASFWMNDGQILNSLQALSDALLEIDLEVFSHHVTKDKNDFADWIHDVLDDIECAKTVRRAKTIKATKSAVDKHIKKYLN